LGRGSVLRQPQQSDRYLGGAPDPLPHAGEGGEQGDRDGGRRAHRAGPEAPSRALQVTDLGSRQRDGGPSALLAGDRREGLFLRSAAAVAAWIERKHQRSAAPVLPKRDGPVGYSSEQAQCHRSPAERTAPKDTQLRNAGRTIWPMRCVDRLNPQCIAVTRVTWRNRHASKRLNFIAPCPEAFAVFLSSRDPSRSWRRHQCDRYD